MAATCSGIGRIPDVTHVTHVTHDAVLEALKCLCGILQTEWHPFELPQAKGGDDSSFGD